MDSEPYGQIMKENVKVSNLCIEAQQQWIM